MLYESFSKGINLGGTLSQYGIVVDVNNPAQLEEHFHTFITEENIGQIASWGFDHVRIPMDGYLFFDRQKKELRKEPVAHLERLLSFCTKYKLNAVLDLHDFWGHRYGAMYEPTLLMTDEEIRTDYCRFWHEMAVHFVGWHGCKLLFELFNEISDATHRKWNELYLKAIHEIRSVDPIRWILVGTNDVNSVALLPELELPDDQYVFYNFHYYEPTAFTHQLAHFSEEFRTYNKPVSYPGDLTDYLRFLREHPAYAAEHTLMDNSTTTNDHDLMMRFLNHAVTFMRQTGKELYCGEFGVIDSCDSREAVKWLKDVITFFDDNQIGHAMWNYKCLDFEIVDENNKVVRPDVLALLIDCNKAQTGDR